MRQKRERIDWMPGPAALQALEAAQRMMPDLPRQEIIDRLVIVGLSALTYKPWSPPPLQGANRDQWRLPQQAA